MERREMMEMEQLATSLSRRRAMGRLRLVTLAPGPPSPDHASQPALCAATSVQRAPSPASSSREPRLA